MVIGAVMVLAVVVVPVPVVVAVVPVAVVAVVAVIDVNAAVSVDVDVTTLRPPTGVAAPPHTMAGGRVPVSAFQASGYVHLAIGVGAAMISWASNQPFPALIRLPLVPVYVGAGRVLIAPVEVYEGSRVAAKDISSSVKGGYGYCNVCAGPMSPAPTPPVIHGWKESPNIGPAAAPQAPIAILGSVGIHPPWRPSW